MSKMSKILGLVATAMAGSLYTCGCSLPGCWDLNFGGFCKGLFTKGITNSWCIDMVTDWLAEDIFGQEQVWLPDLLADPGLEARVNAMIMQAGRSLLKEAQLATEEVDRPLWNGWRTFPGIWTTFQ